MAYRGVDFYLVDELFSEEERLVRDAVRDFVSEQLMPVIEKHNREGSFPAHLVPGLAALGIQATAAEAILQTYLDRLRVGGRYNQHAPA